MSDRDVHPSDVRVVVKMRAETRHFDVPAITLQAEMQYTVGVDDVVAIPLDPRWCQKRTYIGGGKFLVRNLHRERTVIMDLYEAGVRWYCKLPDVVEKVEEATAIAEAAAALPEAPKGRRRTVEVEKPVRRGKPVMVNRIKPGRVSMHPEGWGEVEGVASLEVWIEHLPRWFRAGWQIEGDVPDIWYTGKLQASLHVRVDGEMMLVEGTLAAGGTMISPPQLLRSLEKKLGWVEHKGKAVRLPDRADLAFLAEAAKKQVPVELGDSAKVAPLVQGVLDADIHEGCLPIIQSLMGAMGDEHLSPHVKATLRPYQVTGVHWLQRHYDAGTGCLLADGMGLGKTLAILSLLSKVKDKQRGRVRALIICPKTLIENWVKECVKFTPHFNTLVWAGQKRSLNEEKLAQYDIVLTSYPTLLQDGPTLAAQPWDICICDEAQHVKNSDGKTWAELMTLRPARRMAMTGTPIENNLGDLYAIMEFASPGLLGTRDQFEQEWVEPIKAEEEGAMARLRNLIAPFVLRRTKEQVLHDLPDKEIVDLTCPMTAPQRQAYTDMLEHYRRELRGVPREQMMARMFEATTRLRQMATDPRLSPQGAAFRPEHSGKIIAWKFKTAQALANGSKILVFSQWVEMLSLLRAEADRAGWKYCYLDGQTKERGAEVDKFQNSPEIKLFFISLKAGGAGLTLTAADTVFLFDPWWNPASEAQAMDRAHRIGQKNMVNVYRLLADDSIESHIATMQANKAFLAGSVLGDEMTDEQVARATNRTQEVARFFGILED